MVHKTSKHVQFSQILRDGIIISRRTVYTMKVFKEQLILQALLASHVDKDWFKGMLKTDWCLCSGRGFRCIMLCHIVQVESDQDRSKSFFWILKVHGKMSTSDLRAKTWIQETATNYLVLRMTWGRQSRNGIHSVNITLKYFKRME